MSDIASLLMAQQPRRRDPLEQQRRLAQTLMGQGTSADPIRSPWQGVARVVQGGLAGLLMGDADQKDKARGEAQIAGLTRFYNAKTPEERDSALADLKTGGDADALVPILGQLITQKMADERKAQLGTRNFNAMGGIGGAPQAAPGQGVPAAPGMPSGEGGTVIDITPNGPRPPVSTQGAAQSTDAQRVVQFLVNDPDLKFAPHQAAGFVGNLYGESGMKPTAVNPRDGRDGSDSVGLAQWNASRAQALQQFAAANKLNPADFNTQMQFLKAELLGTERPQYDAIRQTGSVDDAAAASVGFFRPKDTQSATLDRTQFADAILRGGAQPGQAPGQPPVQVAQAPGGAPVPQGSADPSGTPLPPTGTAPPMPEISPAAAALDKEAVKAFNGGNIERAIALRQKAQEVQALYAGERSKTQDERAYRAEEDTRKRAAEQPQKNFDNAAKLRDDLKGLKAYQDYSKASTVFRAAVDAAQFDSKAADIDLVYAFATMMDPGSVVRDQETGMVRATQSASSYVKGLIEGLQGKATFDAATRSNLINQMAGRYEAYKAAHDEVANMIGGVADRSGLKREDILLPIPPVEYTRPNVPKMGEKKGTGATDSLPRVGENGEGYDDIKPGGQYLAPDGSVRTKRGAR